MAQELKLNDENKQKSESLLAGKVLVLDGPPASGKGSIAQYLRERFKCIHISTGDLFRDHVQRNTELGRQVKRYLDMKSFVPDQLVVNHVLDRLSQPDAKQYGCILDGFPRTKAQYTALQQANTTVHRVITLQCPDNVLLQRAKGRRIDPSTGNIYHVDYVPPPQYIVNLIKRDMDNNIQRRLDVYHAQHRRFKHDNCIKVNANKAIKEVFADVLRILRYDKANEAPSSSETATAEVKPGECTICLDKPSDFIIIPCGHQCGCEACLTKMKRSGLKCPICRGPITLIQKVYATHTVTVKPAPKPKPPIGAPDMQQIANTEEQIFEEKNDEEWPEDAPDDDEKKEINNECGVSVRIAPANIQNNIHNIVLELCGSGSKGRCAVDICAVLDVSGSMCSSAAVQEDDGSVKNDDGLSRLDLVKHSVKTVIHCLDKNDRISIVKFGSDAAVQYPLSYMTPDGIKKAVIALERLEPAGQTNLWEGLRVGMESLRTKQEDGRLSVVMLLTDGRPTVIPPKGHIHELQKYVDMTNFAVQINTFGFGYDLDSDLLHSLAVHGDGTFAFIPDAKIVGTTFVNSIANVLTTISAETKLHLTAMNGAKFVGKSWAKHNTNEESWGRIIEVGPIMCDTNRYISIPMSIPHNNVPYLECVLSTEVLGVRGKSNKMRIMGVERRVANDLLAGHLTAKAVSIGLDACQLAVKRKGNAALKLLKTLKEEVKVAADIASKADTDDFNQMTANSRVDALNADVSGRLNKAFRGETRFNRWGKHYIRALLRAHQLNMCTNFMDPGLQVNGGILFRELRAKGDEVFVNLPPPKASRRTGPTEPVVNQYNPNQYSINASPVNNGYNPRRANNNQYNPSSSHAAYRPAYRARDPSPVNMRDYYGGGGGGCFAAQCMVNVMDVNTKQCMDRQVCDVRPGDMVKVAEGFATVIFVVELARDRRRRMIELPGGLVITGGHPVRRNGLWCLPREQSDAVNVKGCDTVFTFVLDESHVVIVNGMECVTWGHRINDCVVSHSFYGTDKVIQALQQKSMSCKAVGDPLNNVIAIYSNNNL